MLIDQNEGDTLLLMLGYGMREGFTEGDFDAVMRWAEETRMNAGLLENCLSASLAICVRDGEVQFKMTPKGNREVEDMIGEAT